MVIIMVIVILAERVIIIVVIVLQAHSVGVGIPPDKGGLEFTSCWGILGYRKKLETTGVIGVMYAL